MARAFGVAPSTVSRALSGKSGVSEERRQSILAYALQAGYVPDPRARALRTGELHGLTIVTGVNPNEITSYRNYALFSSGKKMFGDVRVVVQNPSDDPDALLTYALMQGTEAIILSGITGEIGDEVRDLLRSRSVPVVTVDSAVTGFDAVEIDRAAGTRQAARMLLLSGCAHPVFFSICLPPAYDARLTGIRNGFASLGRELTTEHLHRIESTGYGSGYEAAMRVLTDTHRSGRVDGLFCYSDVVAIGAMKAAIELGRSVPRDLRIIGFDNIRVTAYLGVSLTTVSQPVEACAEAALELLRQRVAEPEAPRAVRSFPTELVIRASAPLSPDIDTNLIRESDT